VGTGGGFILHTPILKKILMKILEKKKKEYNIQIFRPSFPKSAGLFSRE